MVARWPLTARSAQLDRLGDWYRSGSSGGAVLFGPAGVGKTRLAEELVALASAAGRSTARAVGHPVTRHIPLGALAHLLPYNVVSEANFELNDRAGMFHAAGAALRDVANENRLVLTVDDIDQLDDTSLALLMPMTIEREVFLVATIRSGQPIPSAIATLIKDGHLERMDVGALADDEVANLLHRVLDGPVEQGALRRLHRLSGGNLQVLHELVRSARDQGSLVRGEHAWTLGKLPRSGALEDLVTSHLAHVPEQAQTALDVLAITRQLGLADLETFCPPDLLEHLERDGLICVEVHDRRTIVDLAHPMYGEVLRARMTTLRLRNLQRALADQLESFGLHRRDDPMRLALWRLEAGGEVDSELLYSAGRLALIGRESDLADRFARATADRGRPVEAARLVVDSASLRADPDAIERAVASVWTHPEMRDDDLTHLATRRADVLFQARSDLDGAMAVLGEALDRVDSESARSKLEAHRASMLAGAGRPLEALAAAELVTITDNPRVRVDLAMTRSAALLSVGRSDEAVLVARAGAAAQADLPPWQARRGLAGHLVNEAHALAYSGRYGPARELIEPAAIRAKAAGALAGWVWFEVVLGEIARDSGRGHEAVHHFTTATEAAEGAGQGAALVWARVGVAQGLLLLGEADAAEQALVLADAAGHSPLSTSATTRERTRAWLMACRGDLAGARDHIALQADIVAEDGVFVFEVALLHDLVRFGDADAAVERLEGLVNRVDGPLVRAMAAHARGVADGDIAVLEQSLDAFEAMDSLVYAAETAADLGDLYRRDGDQRAASANGQRMAQMIERAGGARTPALLRGTGVDPLTSREREVALMAADGLATKEIATRLFVSKRTVDTHLDRIYRKLGITSRDDLPVALRSTVGT
jgi:DNA-binding CsgD family transcriptional regulator